ncbi:hypothetical protein PilKf_02594 [Pillotina sp. SPG140]
MRKSVCFCFDSKHKPFYFSYRKVKIMSEVADFVLHGKRDGFSQISFAFRNVFKQ